MGKAEAGTPKAIANKIKSKGLQKLRWYCQMCERQCKDENGFKCHTTSESHHRQLLLFAENPYSYLDTFSEQFKDGFLDILKRQYGGKRVHSNQIYQEYIRFKEHVHMNATKWLTLTAFVKWLGKKGICAVDETEKGSFVAYIDRSSDAILAEERRSKKAELDMDDERRTQKFIQQQIDRLKESGDADDRTQDEQDKRLQRGHESQKVVIALGASKSLSDKSVKSIPSANPLAQLKKKSDKSRKNEAPSSKKSAKRPSSVLDDIMLEEARRKKKRNDYWLTPGIVVEVVEKSAGEQHYKKKGVLKEVIDRYAAVVKMIESGVSLKVDQVHCETVIPSTGREVKIVSGPYNGQEATLVEIDVDRHCATLKLGTGVVVRGVVYEDFSKLNV